MSSFLWQTFHRLLAELDVSHFRFLYHKLNLDHRLTGIIGPRGVGKTTLLLQYIKEKLHKNENTFYFSADNIYFNENTLLSYIDHLYQTQNILFFFIDEIHKYANWNQELKNIYDSFPNIKVVFSGSSSIDLVKGMYDLSRRAKLFYLPGLSFREYLNIKTNNSFSSVTLEEILSNHQKISANLSQIGTILKYFEEYILFGYYPFGLQNRDNVYETITTIIDKTIYEDIANFYNLKTINLNHFKRIINFLASIPPGQIKTNNLARHLGVDNKTADNYLTILERTGMIKMLYPVAHGNQTLNKPSKIYLDNTTLLAAANTFLTEDVNIGTLRELAFMQFISGAGIKIFYPEKGDFIINNIAFEIGGKNKKTNQLKTHNGPKIIVKDNILIGSQNEIPLYLFGFLY